MARSRRLGIAGEVSVGPDPEVHKKSAGVTSLDGIFVVARIRTGVFLIGKTIIGRCSNKKLLETRPMIVFPIRSCVRPGFVRARRGREIFFLHRDCRFVSLNSDLVAAVVFRPKICGD